MATSLRIGSIPWHAARLAVDGVFYVPCRSIDPNPVAAVKLTLDRAIERGALRGAYLVRMATGFRADLSAPPFRFVIIQRTH